MIKNVKIEGMDLLPLVIRMGLAIVFIHHGYGKLFQGGHSHIAELMAAQGAPGPEVLGWLAGITEFFGGSMLLIGFLSRLWALGLMILMVVAIATVHAPNGFDIRNSGYEYCLTLLLGAMGLFLSGAGKVSLDYLIYPRRRLKSAVTPG